MLPGQFEDVTLSEFYRIVGMARYARRLYQEDIEKGILDAIAKVFPEE